MHVRTAVVLETMWGRAGKSPGWFRINPQNHTGRRLYWLVGHNRLWVTNACPEQVNSPLEHGTPDPLWLARNLKRLRYDLLLVCGKVAQITYKRCLYEPDCRVLEIPHPAWRGWTRERLDVTQELIQSGKH